MAGNGLLNTPQRTNAYASGAPQSGMDDGDGSDMESQMEDQGEGGDQPNVTPDEQNAYNQFVVNGMKLIFNEATTPKLIQRLQADENPIHALAATTVAIVSKLKASAESAGQQVSPDILMHGGTELMSNIAELAKAAKVHTYTPDEQEKALYTAMDMYSNQEMQKGTLDKEGFARDFQTLVAADKAGKLDEVLPGASEAAARMGKRQPQQAPAQG